MPRLSNDERNHAIGMLDAGMTPRAVARVLRYHHTTIARLKHRFQQTGTVQGHPGRGAPMVATAAQDRRINLQHLRDRFCPAALTVRTTPGRHPTRISNSTAEWRLHEANLHTRRPFVGPKLTDRHGRDRLQWCRLHSRWIRVTWNAVLFSDESRYVLGRADGRKRVWRRAGERHARCCVLEADRWGGGSVMVWAGISFHSRTRLHVFRGRVTAVAYRDEVLAPIVAPFIQNDQRVVVFQQDNARAHTARVSMEFLRAQNIQVMPWPSLSPDLAPIEHIWDELDRRVRSRPRQPHTVRQLERALQEEWRAIPQLRIQNVIRSMRQRCLCCIAADGGHTKY